MIFVTGSTDSSMECVNITILDDDAFEGDQTFTVSISTSDLSVMFGTNTMSVTITDNDG